MSSAAVSFARENQGRFLERTERLPEHSQRQHPEEHKSDIEKAAQLCADELKRIGFENVEIIKTEGHPLVYADWLHAAGKPTALCYAHYDVQPAEPLDEWKSPPFVQGRLPRKGRQRAGRETSLERAQRAQSEHLCPRRRRRQRPALDADEGLRVAVQGRQRQAAHQHPRAARGRRRSWRREHRSLRQAECQFAEAEGRLRAGHRHRTVRARSSHAVRWPARAGLHRNRSPGLQDRSALRHVRWRRAESPSSG